MRAIELSSGNLRFREDYEAEPRSDHLIEVRVLKAGICETDVQLVRGYMGFSGVLGHEFVGVAQSGRYAGCRVVGEINCACATCEWCVAGKHRHCPNRTVIGILNHDGAFADSVFVPEVNLHVVPDRVTDQEAVFTEPVAAACRILEQVAIQKRHRVVVFGDGRLGNLCGQVLASTGCRLTVVGKHEWKLQRLRDAGLEAVALDDFLPERTVDFVIDCTGSPSGFQAALQTVKPCGTVILKTTVADQQQLYLAPIVIDEIQVLGSRCGPFVPALDMIANRQVDVNPLICGSYALEAVAEAFEHAVRKDTLKILFDVSS